MYMKIEGVWQCKSCEHVEVYEIHEEEIVTLRHYVEKHPEHFAINGADE